MIKLIDNWQDKHLVCDECGTIKSVKYSTRTQILCNKCALLQESKFQNIQKEIIISGECNK